MNDKPMGEGKGRTRPTWTSETLAQLAKALSHPARVEIVSLLRERQTCIGCDIVDEVGLAQSTTSEHLRVLKAAGIIVGEIERPRVCYSLNAEVLEPLQAFLGDLLESSSRPAVAAVSIQGLSAAKKSRRAASKDH